MPTPGQLWGEIRQLGYVIPDGTLEQAIADWARVRGVGPWYVVEHAPTEDFVHRGQPGRIDFTFALAQAGTMQIELIVQHNDQPSTYREFLAATHQLGGLHHLAYWPQDMDVAYRQATEELGFELWSGGRIGPSGLFRYFLTQDHPGTVVEHANIRGGTLDFFAELTERNRRFDPATDDWYVTRG